jgi:esterase/lipase superfamily enzyme
MPFIYSDCQTRDIGISTVGASLGAYHAVNTLFRYPHRVKRCYGLSGVYDLKRFMDGQYDDNFYFHNPMDYVANLHDGWTYEQLASCEIRLATGSGPWEESRFTYAFSHILHGRGINHHLDDWGPLGGHDWPFWKNQMREYLSRW